MLGNKAGSDKPTNKSRLEIENLEDEYQILQQIGRGSFASVVKARQKFGNHQIRAIKKITINPLSDEIGEVERLKSLRGDHIIQFFGYIIDNNELNLIMKYCQGSLRDQIKKKKQFTPSVILNLMVQVTSAMISLSQKSVMHLDLKPQNILYEKGDLYKLCDFGCSQLFQSASKATLARKYQDSSADIIFEDCGFGTAEYISPEIQLGKYQVRKNSCDIWSFGIILYELIYKKHPFKLDQFRKVSNKDFTNFLKSQLLISYPKVDPSYPIQILQLMLKPLPDDRLTWKSLKSKLILRGRNEIEFLSLQIAASSQINLLLIFGTIIMFINDNLELNDHTFWKENSKDLHQMKELLIYLSQAHIQKFQTLFAYKKPYKLGKKRTENLIFILESFKEEQKKLSIKNKAYFAEKRNIEFLQENLNPILSKLSLLAKKYKKERISIQHLSQFIQQAKKVDSLFGQGHQFKKTCEIFDINENN